MRNQAVILTIAISLLVMGGVFAFISVFYIPSQTEKIRNQYEMSYKQNGIFVITKEDGIYEGTEITQEYFDEGSIEVMNIPNTYILRDNKGDSLLYSVPFEVNASNKKQAEALLLGKVTSRTIQMGEIATLSAFDNETKLDDLDHESRQREIEVNNTIGTALKAGVMVDIVVAYKNGDYDVVVPKKLIDRVVVQATQNANGTSDGQTQTNQNNKDGKMKVMVSLKETEYRDIELAKRLGDLELRLYKDFNQIASVRTFKYDIMKDKVLQLELMGDIIAYYEETVLGFPGDKTNIEETVKARIQNELNKLKQQASGTNTDGDAANNANNANNANQNNDATNNDNNQGGQVVTNE